MFSWQENVPDSNESVLSSANKLFIIGRVSYTADGARVSFALSDELAASEVEDADNTETSSNCKVLVVVTNADGLEFIGLSFEGAAF